MQTRRPPKTSFIKGALVSALWIAIGIFELAHRPIISAGCGVLVIFSLSLFWKKICLTSETLSYYLLFLKMWEVKLSAITAVFFRVGLLYNGHGGWGTRTKLVISTTDKPQGFTLGVKGWNRIQLNQLVKSLEASTHIPIEVPEMALLSRFNPNFGDASTSHEIVLRLLPANYSYFKLKKQLRKSDRVNSQIQ
jgi:hypothetical protein